MKTSTKEKRTVWNGHWFYGRVSPWECIGGTYFKMVLCDNWGNPPSTYIIRNVEELKNNHYFKHGTFYFSKKAYEKFINEQ